MRDKTAGLKAVYRDVRLLQVFRTVTKTAQTVRICAAAVVFAVIVIDAVRMIKSER